MTHDIYTVFGNEVRAKLILCLSEKPKNVSELISKCGLAQSAVSQHLKKLKASGLVESRKEGKEVWYSLRYPMAAKISELLMDLEKTTNI